MSSGPRGPERDTGRHARVRRALWLLPAAFTLHELEEWNILAWYERYWTNLDPRQFNETVVHTFLIFAIVAFASWTWLALRLPLRWAAHLVLVPFVLIVFGHSFLHVAWVVENGAYAPGVVTAAVLIVPITAYVVPLVVRERVVARSVALVLVAASLLQPLFGADPENEVPSEGMPHLRFAAGLLERLGWEPPPQPGRASGTERFDSSGGRGSR